MHGPKTRYNDPASDPYSSSSVENWCYDNMRYKPQGNSMAVELLLLLASSMTLGRIFYNPKDTEVVPGAMFFACFAVGALAYQPLRQALPRKVYKQAEIMLFYIGGAVFLAGSEQYWANLLGKSVIGLGTGLVYVEFLTKVAEVAVPSFRGMFASSGGMIYLGFLMLGSSFTSFEGESFGSYQWTGVVVLIYSFMAQVFMFVFAIESPVYFLSRGEVSNAERAMMRLRTERELTTEIRRDIRDFQEMLVEDATKNKNILSQGNLNPLVLVLAARFITVATLNLPFTSLRTTIADQLFSFTDEDTGESYFYGGMVLSGARMAITLILLFIIDFVGRKKLYLTSAVCSSIVALVLGCLVFFDASITLLAFVCVAFEVFAALGFCGISDVYTCEAFCTTKKSLSVGFVLAMEQIAQAALLVLFNVTRKTGTEYGDYWYIPIICGVSSMVIGIVSWMKLPETAHLTYRQSRSAFLKDRTLGGTSQF